MNSLIDRPKREWALQSPTCRVEGCDGTSTAKSLCGKHYGRLRKYGSTDLPESQPWVMPESKICTKCKIEKPAQDFHIYRNRLRPACKICLNKMQHNSRLISTYGITLQQYEDMLEAQDHKCTICGGFDSDRRLSVDHNHDTGAFRGLLCHQCNTGLGLFKDDIHLMKLAIQYLEDNQ